MNNENKPEKEFKAGLISAAVWTNKSNNNGRDFEFKTVTLNKRYKIGNDWKNTSNMKIDDIPKLILLLQNIYAIYTLSADSV